MSAVVLVVEDNEQNRYLITYLLEAHGYRVVCAHDGPRALTIVEETVPDVILLDIQLPHMDGYAVARALRSREPLRHTPLIAVTSYAMAGDRAKSLAAGCSGYIEKPIDPDTFIAEMEQFIASPETLRGPS